MVNIIIIWGSAALSFRTRRMVFNKKIYVSGGIELCVYAMLDMITTFLVLSPLGRLSVLTLPYGVSIIRYGKTAMLFSVVISVFYGCLFGTIIKSLEKINFIDWLKHFILSNKKKILCVILVTIFVLFGAKNVLDYMENQKWYNKYKYIAHALGEIDDHIYTNSLEAFRKSYEMGYKVYEIDLAVTSDKEVVLKHDWKRAYGLPSFENGYIPALEEFNEAKIYDQYTTLNLNEMFQLMLEHSDIYVLTDSKSMEQEEVEEQFKIISEYLNNYSKKERRHLEKHFIIQIYKKEMYEWIENIYNFDNYVYTLYQQNISDLDSAINFCKLNDIPVIAIPYRWWDEGVAEKVHENSLKLYVHTLNDVEIIVEGFEQGMDGIYTDSYISE